MLPVFVASDSAFASFTVPADLVQVAITIPKPAGAVPGDAVIAVVIADVPTFNTNNEGSFAGLGFPQDDAGASGWRYNGFSSFGSTNIHSKAISPADAGRTGWEFTYLVNGSTDGPLVDVRAVILAYRHLGVLVDNTNPRVNGSVAINSLTEPMYGSSYYTHANPLLSPQGGLLPDAQGNGMILTVWACYTQRQNPGGVGGTAYPPVPATFTAPVGPLADFDGANPQTVTQVVRVDAGAPMGLMVAETVLNRVQAGYVFPLLGPMASTASVLSPPGTAWGGFVTTMQVTPQGGCEPYLPAQAHSLTTRVVLDEGTQTLRGRAARAPSFTSAAPRSLCAPPPPASARDPRVRVRERP